MSAVSKFEAGMVATGRGGEPLMSKLTQILRELDIAYVPFDDHQADIARDAFARFGKGRHPAGLNFGDCAAYALSIAEAESLLFKGTNFGATDVEIVRLA
jgi:ribonuclease VapC